MIADFLIGVATGICFGLNISRFLLWRKEIDGLKTNHTIDVDLRMNSKQFEKDIRSAHKAITDLKKEIGL